MPVWRNPQKEVKDKENKYKMLLGQNRRKYTKEHKSADFSAATLDGKNKTTDLYCQDWRKINLRFYRQQNCHSYI